VNVPRDNPASISRSHRVFWSVAIVAATCGALAALVYARLDLTLSHYDARAHLVVARRVLDSLTPGWRQLGALWLPLPHLVNLAPVQWDVAYRSGLVGVAISVVSLAGGLGALARYLHRAGAAYSTAVIVPLGILANPNVLYLQSTPMTEPMLIGASLVALNVVDGWTRSAGARERSRAGWWLAALVLIRYEGWLVAAGLLAIAALSLGRARVREVLTVALYPAAAVLAFLCLSRASTGAWFVSGGFFVAENPSLDRPLAALDQITTGLRDLAGRVVPAAGAAGAVTVLVLLARRPAVALPLALVLPALLPLSAFTAGHPYRIRYMVPLVAGCWALAGAALSRLPRPWQLAAASVLAMAALIEARPFGGAIPMVIEAQRERPQQRARAPVTRYLATGHDDTPILASMGSLGHYMQETSHIGISLREYLHEGNGDLWIGALERPRSHVRWILIEELAEGGDTLAARARNDARFLDGFKRVAEGGGVALYWREK
jgi:hypothetical protein